MEAVEQVVYINLASQPERRAMIESELSTVLQKVRRFDAIRPPGPITCGTPAYIASSRSHIAVLKSAIAAGHRNCLVLEDDAAWLHGSAQQNLLAHLMAAPYDVILLCGLGGQWDPHTHRITVPCQTSVAYLVSSHYYETLLRNFEEGLALLIAHPTETYSYAIDMYWKTLQTPDMWFMAPMMYQQPSFSTICSQHTDYSKMYTNGAHPLIFMCAQPADEYHAWQLQTMLHNFARHGIMDRTHVILDRAPAGRFAALQLRHPSAHWFWYPDTRADKSYTPTIRPHLLAKHFAAHPQRTAIFMHDCDVIFTRPPTFDDLAAGPVWHMSDTVSYIGHDYIVSKGPTLYNDMCAIVGIDPSVPRSNQAHSGGAQYITKNTTPSFWAKVESDSQRLYAHFLACERAAPPPQPGGEVKLAIQKWTAEMWAVLWNAWLHGHQTRVHPRLDFAWPNNSITVWNRCAIFHNAGVLPEQRGRLFYKGDCTSRPPSHVDLVGCDMTTCSHMYVQELIAADVCAPLPAPLPRRPPPPPPLPRRAGKCFAPGRMKN